MNQFKRKRKVYSWELYFKALNMWEFSFHVFGLFKFKEFSPDSHMFQTGEGKSYFM